MPNLEIVPITPDREVLWTADNLKELLESVDPLDLPNAKRLGDPRHPETPAGYPTPPGNLAVLLPNIGTPTDYVLRRALLHKQNSRTHIITSQTELGRLERIGRAEGIGQLVLPHSIFIATNDRHTQRLFQGGVAEEYFEPVYTIIDRVDHGQNLRDKLKDSASQDVLFAIARTQIAYYKGLGKRSGVAQHDGNTYTNMGLSPNQVLYDASGHYQYSLEGHLYDVSHDVGDDLNEIGDDVNVLYEWVRQLLPSPDKRALLKELRALRKAYPWDHWTEEE